MCSPALFLGIGGAVVQGIGAVQSANTQAANQRIQGDAATRDANLLRETGAYEGARAVERGKQLIGRQVAGFASRGISPATGSALDVISKTGEDISLDIAASRYGTQRAVENDQSRARVAYQNAADIQSSAPFAFIAPIINAGATFMRGAYA